MRVAVSMALALMVLLVAGPWCLRAERKNLEGMDRRWLWALALLVAVVATARVLVPNAPLRCDDGEFLAAAARGYEYASTSRAPGLPMLLAFLGSFATISLDLAYLANGAAAVALPVLAFLLGWRWFGTGAAALAAAACVTLHPLVFVHGQSSEYHVWANTLFLAVVVLAAGYPRHPGRASLIVAAAAGALCVCFGVELVALVVPLLCWMLFVTWRERAKDWDVVATVALSFGLMVAPVVHGLLISGRKDGSLETAVDFASEGGDAAASQVAGYVRDQTFPAFAAIFTDPELMPLISALGLVGIALVWRLRGRLQALLAACLVVGLPFLYFGTHRGDIESHRHQLVLPLVLLAVLGGGAFGWLAQRAGGRRAWAVAVAGLGVLAGSTAWSLSELEDTLDRNAAWSQSRTVTQWLEIVPGDAHLYVDDPERLSLFDPDRPWRAIARLREEAMAPAGSWVLPGCNPTSCSDAPLSVHEEVVLELATAGKRVRLLSPSGGEAPLTRAAPCGVALEVMP